MSEVLFKHTQYGPYEQGAGIVVRDGGNGLPIHLTMRTGDPFSTTSNSMTISQAKLYRDELSKAIVKAEEAGIEDAGW
jgi:hypothetical protein